MLFCFQSSLCAVYHRHKLHPRNDYSFVLIPILPLLSSEASFDSKITSSHNLNNYACAKKLKEDTVSSEESLMPRNIMNIIRCCSIVIISVLQSLSVSPLFLPL